MPKTTTFPPAAPKTDDPWIPEGVVHTVDLSPYAKTADLTPYAKSADVMPKAASITGYDATKAQTLQHDATGALKWVDNATE